MKLIRLVVGYIHTNCYLLINENTNEAVVVDPGWAGDKILEAVEAEGAHFSGVLLTHGHFDHIFGFREMIPAANADGEKIPAETTENAPFEILAGSGEKEMLASSEKNGTATYRRPISVTCTKYLEDGEVFEIAGITLRTIHTPGHTSGSACYYLEEAGVLIAGDTLFRDSYGRTDFETGSLSDIRESITGKLFTLPEDTQVLPGHGEATTIGREKKINAILFS